MLMSRDGVGHDQTCAESHFLEEKSSQVTQKSNYDFDFFQIFKKVKSFEKTKLKFGNGHGNIYCKLLKERDKNKYFV
jgi:hypothetical protein